jgi:Protein of unknown function (DUF3263)
MTSVLPGLGNDLDDDLTGGLDDDGTDELGIDDDLDVVVAMDADDFDDDPEWDAVTPALVEKSDPGLTDQQRHMLIFERQWWRHAGSKEQAIREQFSLSATRYYQMLNQLLDVPAALEFDAMVVGRLRRLRATRARTRMAR